MDITYKVLTGAVGGGLIVYGLIQRSKAWDDDSGVSGTESWWGLIFGGFLVLAALLS